MKNKFIKKLFTAAIAATTALSVFNAPLVFADKAADEAATAMAVGEANAKVAINKTLNIAEGITTPNATFTFTFTPKAGTSSNKAPYEMASTTDAGKGFIADRSAVYTKDVTAVDGQAKKDTGDIFAGVSYDHAGEYVYDVAEKDGTYTPIKDKNGQAIDAVKYDTRTYEMHVIVKNKKSGTDTYISSVYFKQNGVTDAPKKAPSDKTDIYKYDLFENTYSKDGGKIDPTDPKDPNDPTPDKTDKTKKSLTILKKVDGDSADKTKNFQFELTVTLPKSNATALNPVTSITVNIGGKAEEIQVDSDNVTFRKQFTLKHDQDLTIDNVPAGSHYTVKETGTLGYTASAVYKENGADKTQAGTQAADFTMTNVLIGEKTNDNTVTNKFQDVTPTGLLIDNLPFILMIGLGLAGFVALSRKRRQA